MKKVLLIVCAMGIAMTACKKDQQVPPMKWVGDEVNNKAIELVQGQELKISLTDANLNGYIFNEQPGYSTDMLQFVGHAHDWPTDGGSYPGPFGADSWVFVAKKTGTTTVTMKSVAPDGNTIKTDFQAGVNIAKE